MDLVEHLLNTEDTDNTAEYKLMDNVDIIHHLELLLIIMLLVSGHKKMLGMPIYMDMQHLELFGGMIGNLNTIQIKTEAHTHKMAST
ncbi:MAG: hypothetical protein BGO30_01185 [Bacteroidetes bacterium 41-46]|nr:MAG: hypothetical protein BGO30_01185 [Bacteroidetes bacterium 41-46]